MDAGEGVSVLPDVTRQQQKSETYSREYRLPSVIHCVVSSCRDDPLGQSGHQPGKPSFSVLQQREPPGKDLH